MGLIDTHAHLTDPQLAEQIDAVLGRCWQAGVDVVLTVGVDLEDAANAVRLSERHGNRIYAATAFHPHEAAKVSPADLAAMRELWNHPGVVALGEMGLDYHYDFADRATQRQVFSLQLQMADSIDKPVVIHCREAFRDTADLLRDHGFAHRPVVFHCFTGSTAEAAEISAHGWRISFTGVVTFPKSNELQAIARDYPADALMIETDSPYLSPVPVRGKRPNEPANVVHIARFLAKLRQVQYDLLARQLEQNSREFFGLSKRPDERRPQTTSA